MLTVFEEPATILEAISAGADGCGVYRKLQVHSVADAVAELGEVAEIRKTFIGFQKHLYAPQTVA